MSEAAPGRLDLVRRFLNTVSFTSGGDGLHGPDRLLEWCGSEGFAGCGDSQRDLDRMRAFREALRGIAFANAGHGDSGESWQALVPFAAETPFQMKMEDAGPALSPAGEGADFAIASVLAQVYDAVRTGEWPRFKACRADDCRWAFYDESKNGSGTWCSMAECGNRMKARRRRRRSSNVSKVAVGNA